MRYLLCLGLLMGLVACSNAELEQQLNTAKTERDEATAAKTKLEAELAELKPQLEELEPLRNEVKTLTDVKTELEQAQTRVGELEKVAKEVEQLRQSAKKGQELEKRLAFLAKQMKDLKATISTNHGDIKVKFFSELAPIHCFNFIARAESGYYNKTQFHRVIPGFMIQGGDPNTKDMNFADDGQGTPMVSIPHEFHDRHHSRGVLSMARRGDPRFGAGSQFFIMHADAPQLNNQYTVFGEVLSGMDVVDKIAAVKRNRRDHPIEPVWVETVTISRN